ncbi:AGR209Wp [Eremothecium gossypii ATCC 10895]|uniref:AGR209Wp n=1 Tax=Eremothecium gossypii (strain ATCC 10895 / CBS 109.51 / FGSC 9923 / NRRL Y-1056) TaxID=284811 RepID=Q74ZJ3_EREGS|nr:AGR209Wp [Eremothecium gossypii ATCC 10895]AAS54699.2 AGR209Wp [Eremothecium gossypii ATCC 10895]AEY99029.1 FAGR209Wp [Eremothecium gossypii FDAG1]
MNFNQDNLNSISAQLHELSFAKPGAGLQGSQSYHSSTSLLDSIGIQRAKSPYAGQEGAFGGPFQKGQLPLMGSWGQGAYQQPMTPSTPLSSTAVTPLTASNVPLSTFQLEHGPAGPALLPGVAAPPGFGGFMAAPQLQETEWNYIDQAGQIQGPFTSGMMDSWYAQRFFMQTLQIKMSSNRLNPLGLDENVFITLMGLISKVNDFIEPFKRFDVICWQFQQQLQAHEQPQMQTPITSPESVHPHSGWQPTQRARPLARIDQHDYTYEEMMQIRDNDGGRYQEVSVVIPISKTVKKLTDEEYSIEWDAHNVKMTMRQEALEREAQMKAKAEAEEEQRRQQEERPEGTMHLQIADQQPSQEKTQPQHLQKQPAAREPLQDVSAPVPARPIEAEHEPEVAAAKRMEAPVQQAAAQRNTQQFETTLVLESSAELDYHTRAPEAEAPYDASVVDTKPKEAPAKREIKAKPAPWANKTPAPVEGPSLIDIQRKEEEKKKKREQELLLKNRKQALKLQQDLLKEEQPSISITTVASWASKTKPADVIKAVKDFDETYQAQMKEKEFIEEQKRLWEKAQKIYKTQKTAAKPAESEWTKVSSAKQTQPKIVPKALLQPATYTSPDKLRAVSASSAVPRVPSKKSTLSISSLSAAAKQPAIAYGGNASTSARQEFLRWCRSQMKLLPGVEINSVLEMLLSLPAGTESQEIIADTIYSNSSIMDGRRFAAEFIKRRIECEKKVVDPLTWSQALSLPDGDTDDWEFQVVGKKKGRRH